MQYARPQRPTLTLRDPGVERLLASLPYTPADNLDDVRRWAVAFMDSASRWQVNRRRNSLGGAHGVR